MKKLKPSNRLYKSILHGVIIDKNTNSMLPTEYLTVLFINRHISRVVAANISSKIEQVETYERLCKEVDPTIFQEISRRINLMKLDSLL